MWYWILLGILILILFLLRSSLVLLIDVQSKKPDDAVPDGINGTISVHYLFFSFSLYPAQEESAKKKAKKQTNQEKNTKQHKPTAKAEEKPGALERLQDFFTLLKNIVSASSTPLLNLVKKISLDDVMLDLSFVGEDAADTALQVGKAWGWVSWFLGILKSSSKLKKVESIDIVPDFYGEKTSYSIRCKAKLPLGSLLGTAVGILFRFLRESLKKNAL